VRFEWDECKNAANLAKHGVSFETAALVFEDSNLLLFIERIEDCEEPVARDRISSRLVGVYSSPHIC
jgi:uncharacterized DUF497 family protein